MVTLHEILYLMDREVDVSVRIYAEEVIEEEVISSTEKVITGESGKILSKLVAEKSPFLDYCITIQNSHENIYIVARNHKENEYDVLYEGKNGRAREIIKAINYNQAHNKAAEHANNSGFDTFWIRLEKGIG